MSNTNRLDGGTRTILVEMLRKVQRFISESLIKVLSLPLPCMNSIKIISQNQLVALVLKLVIIGKEKKKYF